MKKYLMPALRLFLCLAALTGLIYPLAITGLVKLTFPRRTSGSIIYKDGIAVGSSLIAQKFEKEGYFWPRPSANDYKGTASGGSNLGPTSAALKDLIQKRKQALLKASGLPEDAGIPAELLCASGSGLDPHISPNAALFQVERIAKARNVSIDMLQQLIKKYTEKPSMDFIGAYRVNVLKLNIALDQLGKVHHKDAGTPTKR